MVILLNDKDSVPPLSPKKKAFRANDKDYVTCAGLHLFYAPTKSGKSVLTAALGNAIDAKVTWLYVNEPGGTFMEDKELEEACLKSASDYIFVDSLTTYLMSIQASGDSPAMAGGMTMGLAKGVARLDKKIREAGKVVVATVNSSLMSCPLKDAMVHGQLSGDLRRGVVTWHDRGSGRVARTIELTDADLESACQKLGYTGPPITKSKDEVDAQPRPQGSRSVNFREKEI